MIVFPGWPLLSGADPRSPRFSDSLGLVSTFSTAGSIHNRSFADFLGLLQVGRRPPRFAVVEQRGPMSFCTGPSVRQRGYYFFTCTIPNGNVPAFVWTSSVSQALALLQTIAAGKEKDASVTTTMALVQSIQGARAESVTSAMALVQTIAADLRHVVTSALGLAQAVGVQHVAHQSVAQAIAFVQAIVDQHQVHLLQSDALNLVQRINTIRSFSFSNMLLLVQQIERVQPASLNQAMALVDAILSSWSKPNSSPLNLVDVATAHVTANRSQTSTLGLTQGIIAWKQPVSGSSGNPTPCDLPNPHDFVKSKTVTFTGPFTSPTTTVTLRAPKFGNVDSVDVATIVRRNRGGEFKVSRPSTWPTIEVLKMTWEGLADSTRADLLSFMEQFAGKEVGFLDHEGKQWRGVVLTPVLSVAQAYRVCAFEIELEFRGRRTN